MPLATAVVPAPPFVGYHRYRGTVGGQPVTVELIIEPETENSSRVVCEGSYSYDQHPAGQLLLSGLQPFRSRQMLLLTEVDSEQPHQPTGRWQAVQIAGSVLSGTWTSPGGKQLIFNLHEDYTDGQGHLMAVRYEVLNERVEGAACKPEPYDGETRAEYRERQKSLPPASLDRQFLHLLGADTLQPNLRRLQCPLPGPRRRAMRAALQEAGDCTTNTDNLAVTYIGHGLLATHQYHETYFQGTSHPSHEVDATVYDLRTGRALALVEIVKPGTDRALRQLITQHLRQEMELEATEAVLKPAEGDSTTTELPITGMGLAADGLTFQYTDYELGAYAYGMPLVTISWAEMLPLLRPASPVARMLRARGLWRVGQK
jgi:hypothetical protein